MDDIRPHHRPTRTPPASPPPQLPLETRESPTIVDQPTLPLRPVQPSPAPKRSFHKRALIILAMLLLLSGIGALAVYIMYQTALSAVNPSDTNKIVVVIEPGSSPTAIASTLRDNGLIRNTTAFSIYTRLTATENKLQAGSFRMSPSESTPEIVGHLIRGENDTIDITFLPGQTIAQHKEVFAKAGYSAAEIEAGFATKPDRPLFAGRPTSADLEGYIFGETYRVGSSATVQEILNVTFGQFEKVLAENDLVTGFERQGLTLFEGIIMASIIEKEAVGGDERQIAQVFLKRLEIGMMLGADPTYQYITDKLGQPRSLDFDSLYNTRRYAGIPPGPIASPGLASLLAIANPADGDYLFFLSGDDDVTYYGRTFEEHTANIRDHCKLKCQFL